MGLCGWRVQGLLHLSRSRVEVERKEQEELKVPLCVQLLCAKKYCANA